MHYIDDTKHLLSDLVGRVLESASSYSSSQTVTIARPRAEVERFWRDPANLSEVLGDVAEVRSTGPSSYEWTLHSGADGRTTWKTTLHDEEEGRLRFVGSTDDDTSSAPGLELELRFRDAPRDLGTEVTMRARTPLPDVLTGAATFTALYRARARLQTGEMPTLAHNPSARDSAR
ncbi:SRPBCC family protein [Nocardia barduliensis]|uniref:SRPBCC family protein n=1 Tax=Nocardia barduliensis TaxID=2736643 RepID=UPI00157311AC|nr:SRPBCC family protein [Nocardia barduliensis]